MQMQIIWTGPAPKLSPVIRPARSSHECREANAIGQWRVVL